MKEQCRKVIAGHRCVLERGHEPKIHTIRIDARATAPAPSR
jgi:hypothetical protein